LDQRTIELDKESELELYKVLSEQLEVRDELKNKTESCERGIKVLRETISRRFKKQTPVPVETKES